MGLTVAVPITPDEQEALEAQARVRGVPVDRLLRNALLQVIGAPLETTPGQLTLSQWEKEFDQWLDEQPDFPTLPDAALSREQIYSREDEWR